jgi:hypothetical protein
MATSGAVLFRPKLFYRGLITRPASDSSFRFAYLYWGVSSFLFALAGTEHARWSGYLPRWDQGIFILAILGLTTVTFFLSVLLNNVAARLSVWEGNYRGLRLTLPAVRRSLNFHSVHYLPVAAIAAITVLGRQQLIVRPFGFENSAIYYLSILSAEVVLGAIYLFWTYWIAMRTIMYANA